MTSGIILCCSLLLWVAAFMLIRNEYEARRNSIVPTIVLGNSFVGAIMIFVSLILAVIAISQLLSR